MEMVIPSFLPYCSRTLHSFLGSCDIWISLPERVHESRKLGTSKIWEATYGGRAGRRYGPSGLWGVVSDRVGGTEAREENQLMLKQ